MQLVDFLRFPPALILAKERSGKRETTSKVCHFITNPLAKSLIILHLISGVDKMIFFAILDCTELLESWMANATVSAF